jgi:Tfp pilus assembly PilM family ATPase
MGQQIAVIEFSTRTTAVWLRQDDKGLVLANYCFVEGPLRLADCSREALTQHLTAVRRGLGAKTRDVILTLGAQDSALRTVEAPLMSRHELRRLFKVNANHFFHEDISGHALDCIPAGSTEHRRTSKVGPVMVGSTRQDLLDNLQGAAKRAGFNPVQVTLNQAGLANAAVKGMDKLIHKEALMLLDIGADLSSVSFLVDGTLVLNHTINLGNNQLGTRLADAYKVPSHISEEHKSSVIQSNIQNALRPLAHEVQAAIDYFEDSHGKRVLDG